MIETDTDAAFTRLAAHLLAKARAIAAARSLPPVRCWRDARLLWPLLGRG